VSLRDEDRVVVSVDTETGGLEPREHAVLQVAMYTEYVGDEGEVCEAASNVYVKPGQRVSVEDEAMRHNNVSEQDIRERGVSEHETANTIVDFVEHLKDLTGASDVFLLAHNAEFDKAFLEALFDRQVLSYPFHYHTLDSLSVADFLRSQGIIESKGLKLENLALQVLDKGYDFHDAMSDARACYELYDAFIEETQKNIQGADRDEKQVR